MRRLRVSSLTAALLLAGANYSDAQGQAAPAQRARPLPSIAERTSGYQKLDEFKPLYWDESSGTLYLEIPRLDQEGLHVTGLSAGLGSNDIGLDRAQLLGLDRCLDRN